MDAKNSQRKSMAPGTSSRVDAEVSRLLSKPSVDKEEFMKLRNKMGDNQLVDQIQAAYMESYEMVERRAKAFASKILEKYGMTNQPYSQLLLKAHKYARKYELSDAEITAFKRILERELAGADRPDVPVVNTNMSKVLGDITVDTKGFGMKVSDADYRELQDILRMKEEDKPLHSQVVLQSLSYDEGSNSVATSGKFMPENGHNLACHVHPVIAALFFMKEDVLEHHFLYSSLANIVACRYNKEPFRTRPDYELFYNLVTDPNDVVCDSRSPVKDLKNRCFLQKQIWQSVLALRNGQYYNCSQLDLIRAIDMCRLNKYDKPDLVFGRYDGTIIKRLFASLSFRPTVVLSVPTPQVMSFNPYFNTGSPMVSSISMINLRLPEYTNTFLSHNGLSGVNTHTSTSDIKLENALKQSQLFFENGVLIMKNTEIVYSRGVLTFFVDRRKHDLQLERFSNPLNMVSLPSAIVGFERVNTSPITVDKEMKINSASSSTQNQTYTLRSVVCAKTHSMSNTSNANNDLFVGSKTFFANKTGNTTQLYDPLSATNNNSPVSVVNDEITANDDIKSHGIIFVYQSVTA